jgi:recombination protein RecT
MGQQILLARDSKEFHNYLLEREKTIKSLTPKGMDPARVINVMLASIDKTPALRECTALSLFRAACHAIDLGFYPGSHDQKAYLVPFSVSGKPYKQAQLIPGYRGLIDLAHQSPKVKSINVKCVYKGDVYKVVEGSKPCIVHEPKGCIEPAKLEHTYAVIFMDGKNFQQEAMTREEVERVRSQSRNKGDGAWVHHYSAMCAKTVLRKALKYVPTAGAARLTHALALEDYADTGDDSILAEYKDLSGTESEETTKAENPRQAKSQAMADKLKDPFEGYTLTDVQKKELDSLARKKGYQIAAAAQACEVKTYEALKVKMESGK